VILGLPECREVLILAPHPDDEALGCGGTIALLQEKGVLATVAFLTDGESLNGPPSPKIAAARREEGRKCSGMLGCEEPIFIGLPDGELESHIGEGVTRLSSIIELKRPDLVFSPSPLDYHRDHLATAKIAMRLMKESGAFRVAFYEVYSTVRFTHLVDITEVLDKKKKAILTYRTSLYGRPGHYVNACLGLNVHRSLFVQEEGYYEAFCVVEKDAELEMVRNSLCYRDLDLQ
jgi:LmbE family N-acetylglucosaminyl deacetylase